MMSQPSLKESDPELHALIAGEAERQRSSLELIASENFTSKAVIECLGSCLTNKYSEGLPGARYYGGVEYIDKIESLCIARALTAFNLDPKVWGVNVQAYSGSPANLAVYLGLLRPHDRIMGLHLPSGGHLTHGHYTPTKRLTASSILFEPLPYLVDPKTGVIDYDDLLTKARLYRPKLIICGASSYVRKIDFSRFRAVADEVSALLMADMAHIAGLVAAGVHPSPFDYCDVVTTTTHKTLRGPRSGLIFFNRERLGTGADERINSGVFPVLQGGPHNHQIAAVAAQLKEVVSPEFKAYAEQVVLNAKKIAALLMEADEDVVSGGTENHIVLWKIKEKYGVSGGFMELVADAANITLNKNAVPGDTSALSPSGVRVGTPAMTSRGCKEEDMKEVVDLLLTCVRLCESLKERYGPKLSDARRAVAEDTEGQISALKEKVRLFAIKFPLPGGFAN